MSTKEMIYNAVDRLSDKQASELLAFINNMFGNAGNTAQDETLNILDDVRNGRNLSRPFNDLDELWEDLNADD